MLTNKQKMLKSTYMKLYRKLEKYSQSPKTPLKNPWKRDIARLSERWNTVKTYVNIYNRYKRSVERFNEKYLQKIKTPEPSTRIDTRTLRKIEAEYGKWKTYRKSFVRKIANEDEIIINNLKSILVEAKGYITPNKFTGQYSNNDERIFRNIDMITQIINEIPKKQPERHEYANRIKILWEELVESIMIVIYDSDQERRKQAWAKIISIITGDGMKFSDIEDYPMEDITYE